MGGTGLPSRKIMVNAATNTQKKTYVQAAVQVQAEEKPEVRPPVFDTSGGMRKKASSFFGPSARLFMGAQVAVQVEENPEVSPSVFNTDNKGKKSATPLLGEKPRSDNTSAGSGGPRSHGVEIEGSAGGTMTKAVVVHAMAYQQTGGSVE